MLAKGHREAAEEIERDMLSLRNSGTAGPRMVIEGAWGAGFHWVAFGCETKHQQHKNDHARLGRFLRDLGEEAISQIWDTLDRTRQGGWYGGGPSPETVQRALASLEQIRLWATQ